MDQEKKYIQIALTEQVAATVERFKKRDDDFKSRAAPVLKGLWNARREMAMVEDLSAFDNLYYTFPNFKHVIDHYRKIASLKKIGIPFYSNPILLVGDPGLGKTYFASQMAKALNIYYDEVSVATMTAGFVMSGISSSWAQSEPGRVVKLLSKSPVANPIFVADEIDKANSDNRYSVVNPFLALLEGHSSSAFKDEFFDLEIDASHINWIFTANETEAISAPILSRLKVFDIEMPNEQEMRQIIFSIYRNLKEKNPVGEHLSISLDDDLVDVLVDECKSAREVQRVLYDAAVTTISDDRSKIMVDDLKFDDGQKQKQRIGFL